jgi:NAD dependent epimerase/dehydratase family enzyme
MGDELLLTSARALPEKLLAAGYRFQFTNVDEALRAALKS